MDLRLILDGGAAPPAPPGKGTESPPPPEEFEKTLQQAQKGDETPGEVAETEPNAPLQKLDSKEKETGKDIPVAILVEQAVTIPVQFMNAPLVVAMQQAAAAPTVDSVAKVASSENVPAPVVSTPTNPVIDPTTVAAAITTTDSGAPAKDDLNILVASLISKKPIDGKVELKICVPANQKDAAMPISTAAVAIAEQTLPKEITRDLNVVAVQATTNAVVTQQVAEVQEETQVPTGTPVTGTDENDTPSFKNDGKIIPISKKGVFSGIEFKNDGKIVPISRSGVFSELMGRMSGDAGQQMSQEDSKSDADDTAAPAMDVQAPASPSSDVPTAPVQNTHALTTAERQKVVDTLTQRIEELSVKSVRNEVRVEMQPAELGSVIVNVRKDLAGLTATLSASNEPLRQALHESRNDLAGALADRSVGQVKIEVRGASADTMNMGQQFNHAQSQNQNPQQQQQSRQTAANLAAMNRELAFAGATEQKAAPRRLSTTALDLEI